VANPEQRSRFRFWLRLISLIGVIVPRRLRPDWRQEWEAELHHRELLLAEWDRLNSRSKLDLMWRSTSAFWDALWLQPQRLEDEMFQDVRIGLRMLMKHPSFTIIAVFTLALGIGANVTIFSVVNSVLLSPLPYRDADRLVFLWSEVPTQNVRERSSGYGTILEWRNQSESFENLAIFDPASVTLTGAAEPEQVQSQRTSANLFSLLGVAPAIGRTFSEDEVQQKARVVVISHGLWQGRFGSSPDILQQTLEIDGVSSQIIGVMPAHFQFPEAVTQMWEPNSLAPNWDQQHLQRSGGPWIVVGRLKPEVSVSQAQLEMNAIAGRLEEAYPNSNKGMGIELVPFEIQLIGSNVRLALWILFAAVGCVLLIACTNVANLTLARGIAREREIAIRLAIGAGRLRLMRQLLTESGILALFAGAVGLIIAVIGIRSLISLSPERIPQLDTVAINAEVLLFTVGVSLLTGLVFGLAPALKTSRAQPGLSLKEGRSASGGVGGRRLRGLLVITEFSLAVLLLSGAGLLVRSFLHLQAVDLGFSTERTLLLNLALSQKNTSDQWRAFHKQVVEDVGSLPGVEAAAVIKDIVISGNPDGFLTIDRGLPDSAEQVRIPFNRDLISDGFFQTLRVPLQSGRFFTTQDNQGSEPVAIINETMSRRFWPGEEPVGKRLKLGRAQSVIPWLTVVGVVGDMRRQSVEREPIAQVFVPHLQNPSRLMNLLVRTSGEPTQIANVVRDEIHSIDKAVPVYGITTLEDRLARGVAQRRFQTWLLTFFSAIALLLAAIGIYGVIHQTVALRTREIGTRLALGAQARDVFRLVIGQGISLALCGIVIGCLAAFGLTRVLTGLLFGVTPSDPVTFLAVPSLLLLVALLACYLPARRATKVDPVIALRHD
jgi:predicted permease